MAERFQFKPLGTKIPEIMLYQYLSNINFPINLITLFHQKFLLLLKVAAVQNIYYSIYLVLNEFCVNLERDDI